MRPFGLFYIYEYLLLGRFMIFSNEIVMKFGIGRSMNTFLHEMFMNIGFETWQSLSCPGMSKEIP